MTRTKMQLWSLGILIVILLVYFTFFNHNSNPQPNTNTDTNTTDTTSNSQSDTNTSDPAEPTRVDLTFIVDEIKDSGDGKDTYLFRVTAHDESQKIVTVYTDYKTIIGKTYQSNVYITKDGDYAIDGDCYIVE
jgi:hypothetical protein